MHIYIYIYIHMWITSTTEEQICPSSVLSILPLTALAETTSNESSSSHFMIGVLKKNAFSL